MKKQVAIYCRTSTNMQKSGLESQRRALVEYCKSRSIKNYLIYEDSGISGTKSSRPSLDNMMKKVRAGEVGAVIVYSFSRFARSTKHLIDVLEEFESYGVNFISLSEQVDLSTAIGKAMYTIISAIAALERDLISERVKNGMKNARAKGKQIGRPKTRNTDLIVSLRKQGYTYNQIRELIGVGHGTITNALRESLKKDKKK